MHINITERILSKMEPAELALLGRDPSNVKGVTTLPVELSTLADKEVAALRATLVRLKEEGTRRIQPLIADIDRWRDVVLNGTSGQQRPRTLRQFADLLTEYIRTSPGQRIYKQTASGEWRAYYVNFIEYEREQRATRHYDYRPANVTMGLLYWQLGSQYAENIYLENGDVDRMTVVEALDSLDILTETEDLRATYLHNKARFDEVFNQIGKQFLAYGSGVPTTERYWYSNHDVPMMRDGVPGKVVLDVLKEQGEKDRTRSTGRLRVNFWNSKKPHATENLDSDDLGMNRALLEGSDRLTEPEPVEVPIHTDVVIYHLGRHQRYEVNVMDLVDYQYNRALGDQLVLPEITKNLIDVLVSQGRISFRDIVEGKGAGACILLGGPPGTGKTLSAEVFAEATERPLLSVHAAQLGTDADEIEQRLEKVLARGSRWNAVVLLDEADVYVNERGSDLKQNAVVAAILRILENHTATIFMTTNYLEKVDDAIISRCLARIDYAKPSVADQQTIWTIMNAINEVGLELPEIDAILQEHNDLTGRDIKQLIKLATLWSASQGEPVSPATIGFVKQFMPTRPV